MRHHPRESTASSFSSAEDPSGRCRSVFQPRGSRTIIGIVTGTTTSSSALFHDLKLPVCHLWVLADISHRQWNAPCRLGRPKTLV